MVLCREEEALERAVRLYAQQGKFGKVYIFCGNVCRKKFMLILSERERMKFGLQAQKAVCVLGEQEDAVERWEQMQKKRSPLKKMRELLRYVQARSYANKMEEKWREESGDGDNSIAAAVQEV